MLNRYLNNHLSSTLTVCWQGKPGIHLKEKLRLFLRPKCHPIFFDSNINSDAVVRLNIYQIFLISAMKFHCYICDLSFVCKFDKRLCSEIIQSSLRYGYKIHAVESVLVYCWFDWLFSMNQCYMYQMIMCFFLITKSLFDLLLESMKKWENNTSQVPRHVLFSHFHTFQ